MKSHIHFSIDRDLICAIMVGVLSGIVTLAMFFLSGYMITQSALGAPLYALMILVVSVKLFGFLRAITRYIERLLSHKTTFTMLRNVRVQFLKMLYPVVPDIYRRFNSSDLITKMISRVEALQNIYLINCNCFSNNYVVFISTTCISDYFKYVINFMDCSLVKCYEST